MVFWFISSHSFILLFIVLCFLYMVQGGLKINTTFLYALTLSNINRFAKLFHCQNH